MVSINVMFLIDVVIVVVGIYFLYLSFKMKKTEKVESFIIAEEILKNCKDHKAFAEFLSVRQMIFSIIMIIAGTLMAIHEVVISFGYAYDVILGVLVISFMVYYKQLTDGRIKYC